jgi:anti-anti-sigma regulatory factor
MADTKFAVENGTDGSLIIAPRGVLGDEYAVELRHSVVHAVRHLRPFRLVVDLRDVLEIGPINLGTLAAACYLGDDHQVAVFVDNSSPFLADQLAAAGVARHRLRRPGGAAVGNPEIVKPGRI